LEITQDIMDNRGLVITALRENPDGYHRITGDLWDGEKGCCPLGVACFVLGIDPFMKTELDPVNGGYVGPYRLLAGKLGLSCIDNPEYDWNADEPEDDIGKIYRKNDHWQYTYSQMADWLEEWWFPAESEAA
jgi:hypothetical protein